MNKYEMISSILADVNSLHIAGVQHWKTAVEIISKLLALQKGLQEEEEKHREQIQALEKELMNRPRVVINDDGTLSIGGETFSAKYLESNQNGGESS